MPIKVQKGDCVTTYEYDPLGNCLTSTDAEVRTTRHVFDGLQRPVQKELPDGTRLEYAYDSDSNLIECCLPHHVSWKASYDSMGRKCAEELQAAASSSQRWEFTYKNGFLTETQDPLQRIHTYTYDPHGRLSQENVDGWQRSYTYDLRGLLTSAEKIKSSSASWLSRLFYPPQQERSLIERSYDPDGRCILESIYLNSNLIQRTHQTWNPSGRSLYIDNHERHLTYHNARLVQVSTNTNTLSYTYNLSGALESKTTPFHTSTIHYNTAGLPKQIDTHLPNGASQESLEWDPTGRLSRYSSPGTQKRFAYNSRGHLQSAGEEKYEFDLATGARTATPHRFVPQEGFDAFNRIVKEISDQKPLTTTYNSMGEVISQNQRQFDTKKLSRSFLRKRKAAQNEIFDE